MRHLLLWCALICASYNAYALSFEVLDDGSIELIQASIDNNQEEDYQMLIQQALNVMNHSERFKAKISSLKMKTLEFDLDTLEQFPKALLSANDTELNRLLGLPETVQKELSWWDKTKYYYTKAKTQLLDLLR